MSQKKSVLTDSSTHLIFRVVKRNWPLLTLFLAHFVVWLLRARSTIKVFLKVAYSLNNDSSAVLRMDNGTINCHFFEQLQILIENEVVMANYGSSLSGNMFSLRGLLLKMFVVLDGNPLAEESGCLSTLAYE